MLGSVETLLIEGRAAGRSLAVECPRTGHLPEQTRAIPTHSALGQIRGLQLGMGNQSSLQGAWTWALSFLRSH